MFIVLYQKSEAKFIYFNVSDDPDVRSMEKLIKKIYYNRNRFFYFATLTFVDETIGYYPIVDRLLEKKLGIWFRDKTLKNYPYKNKDTLWYIFYNYGLASYMRKFMNILQVLSKRKYGCKFTYFWKIELGDKTKRPHIHMLYDHPKAYGITKTHWSELERIWNSGY